MFEFLYAKKINKDDFIELFEKYTKTHYVSATMKKNGDVEFFVGSERKGRDENEYIDIADVDYVAEQLKEAT